MKKVWSMFMLLAVCLVACTNIDDLEDDVDALKSALPHSRHKYVI